MPSPDTTVGASPGPGERASPGTDAVGCSSGGSEEEVAVFSACATDADDVVMSLSLLLERSSSPSLLDKAASTCTPVMLISILSFVLLLLVLLLLFLTLWLLV